jgi:hypothetical protein
MRALVSSSELASLETLELHSITAAPNLEELHAEENNYGSAPSRFIAASKEMSRLRVLRLRDPEVGPLATSDAAKGLEELDLQVCSIDEEAAHALAALPNLEILHLAFARCDADVRRHPAPALRAEPHAVRCRPRVGELSRTAVTARGRLDRW